MLAPSETMSSSIHSPNERALTFAAWADTCSMPCCEDRTWTSITIANTVIPMMIEIRWSKNMLMAWGRGSRRASRAGRSVVLGAEGTVAGLEVRLRLDRIVGDHPLQTDELVDGGKQRRPSGQDDPLVQGALVRGRLEVVVLDVVDVDA